MGASIARRDFLRGRKPLPPVMRPPGAVEERLFQALCDEECRACAEACPENIVAFDASGMPTLDFALEGCTFCAACIDACPTGALNRTNPRPWLWKAGIGSACLSYNGIACRSCVDVCEPQAISFRLLAGGRDVPLLDPDACNGCGSCKAVCPANAVTLFEVTKGNA